MADTNTLKMGYFLPQTKNPTIDAGEIPSLHWRGVPFTLREGRLHFGNENKS